jgi:ribosomal protein S12 methylthiotransferase
MSTGAQTPAVGLVSLGCPKAGADSEALLTRLSAAGYALAQDYAQADLVVINTCGFIEAAIDESLEAIGEALAEHGRVIVTGCLGARAQVIRDAHPEVLAITGPQATDAVMAIIQTHLPAPTQPGQTVPPQGIRLTPPHVAWLKIAEGCNHQCSFCIIPDLRGPLVSRPLDDIMREAQTLVQAGVRELLVISQDTGAYGSDHRLRTSFWQGRPYRHRLTDLCRALAELGVWVRLHYLYPYAHIDELLPLMQDGLILPYLDIPLQHAHPRILRQMKRPAAAEKTLARLAAWRQAVPDLAIRSTFITGFPGETETEFNALLDFLDEAQLDWVGAFAYSGVEGAPANDLPGQLPQALREERRVILMEHQEAISQSRLERRIGQTVKVLVDAIDEVDGAIVRSAAQAPEVDGIITVVDGHELTVGHWANVLITDAQAHDLFARCAVPTT